MKISQLVPAMHYGDAIGDSARRMKLLFLQRGYEAEIYSLTIDEDLKNEIKPLAQFHQEYRRDDLVLLHFALPSPMTHLFRELPGKKLIIYHNITPPEFFAPYSSELANIATVGREELASLAQVTDIALADSEYNRQELEQLNFPHTAVLPLFVDLKRYNQPPDPLVLRMLGDDSLNILSVGRIVPNKKIEDLLKITSYIKRYLTPLVRLILVGKYNLLPNYYHLLKELNIKLMLTNEQVIFTGHVSPEELVTYYKVADIYLSMSEHEGFCLPLVESMHFKVPIIAYNSTAIPYTLGDAGIRVKVKNIPEIAELCYHLANNRQLRQRIISVQQRRLRDFEISKLEKLLMRYISEVVG
ncbi:MAG: glycosyltransferase family 4 protein [Candidatus Aminicenantes bacterium]|nr:glycosyltransferase family 4 protein [Candidatus Aminicenantes bacterium]MDH5714223.1 glycosyltransferase family 4 protein [Candidatus Aminicenantes bacterium]